MSTFVNSLKNTTKLEWAVGLGVLLILIYLYHFSNLSTHMVDLLTKGLLLNFFIFDGIFRKKAKPSKNQRTNLPAIAFFSCLFIESVYKLLTK